MQLVFVPIVSEEIIHDQLSPISNELNKYFPGSFIRVPKDSEEYLNTHSSMDLTYTDEAFGSILMGQYGFIPVLVTNEILKATLVSLTNFDLSDLSASRKAILAANRQDLLLSEIALTLSKNQSSTQLFDNNDNLLISLLRHKEMVGVLPEEDIELLPHNLKTKLFILHQRKVSPLYLLVHPRHASKIEKIQRILFDFHKNWDRSQTKYTYLNYYSLRYVTNQDIERLNNKDLYIRHRKALDKIREIP